MLVEVTREMFEVCAEYLHEKVVNRDSVEQNAWSVPFQFCAMQYINSGRYLSGDEAKEFERVRNVRKNNMEFYYTRSPDIPADFQSYQNLGIPAVRNIKLAKSCAATTVFPIILKLNKLTSV